MSNRKGKGQTVSRTELAEFFGVSGPTVDHWVRTGCPYISKGGKGVAWQFNTADVIAWRIERDNGDDSNENQINENQLRKREQLAKTLQVELKLEMARGSVAPIDQMQKALAKAFANVRANMRNIPSRAVTMLVGETDEARFKSVLMREIDEALEELANMDLAGDEDDDEGDQ